MTTHRDHWSVQWLAAATGGLFAAILGLAFLVLTGCTCRTPLPAPTPRDSGTGSTSEAGISDAPIALDSPIDVTSPVDSNAHVNGSFAVGIQTSLSTNCTRSGADIADISVALVDSTGTCLPVLFLLVGGAGGPVPSLPEARSLCPVSPARFPCFESDILVSVQNLPPGGYHLLVEGTVGGKVCWKGDASIGVSEVPDEQTLTLLHQDGCR